jgi:hypothetical protein
MLKLLWIKLTKQKIEPVALALGEWIEEYSWHINDLPWYSGVDYHETSFHKSIAIPLQDGLVLCVSFKSTSDKVKIFKIHTSQVGKPLTREYKKCICRM